MAGGWAKDGAVQQQIDASLEDALKLVRGRIPAGKSLRYCERCEAEIPEGRRLALPGVRFCLRCQAEIDREQEFASPYNRRGSKDSQLR
jgi:phage/conjugal plasmid C-4 type zinc finger TraR family protein